MSLVTFICPKCAVTFTAHPSCGVWHRCPKNHNKVTDYVLDTRVGKL